MGEEDLHGINRGAGLSARRIRDEKEKTGKRKTEVKEEGQVD